MSEKFKTGIRKAVILFINLINKVVPKKEMILFNSFPDISGNALAVYDYFVNQFHGKTEKTRIIWAVNDPDDEAVQRKLERISPGQKCCLVKKVSLSGIMAWCRSKYILSTHNYITGLKTFGKQVYINLWHGMPFKTIGYKMEGAKENDIPEGDYTIATGSVYQKIMAESFGLPMDRVVITGQPCNDLLFRSDRVSDKLKIQKKSGEKILIWMPTYRKSVVGALHNDGSAGELGVAEILKNHREKLNQILEQQGLWLLIKPHPMDEVYRMELRGGTRIRVLHDGELDRNGLSLYELLGATDVLLTDYSSVYIDYLVLDRPMAFVFDDMEKYLQSRGFVFENALDYLPGEKITKYDELVCYLEHMDELNAKWSSERKRIRDLFHAYPDGNSSQRVCEFIQKIKSSVFSLQH